MIFNRLSILVLLIFTVNHAFSQFVLNGAAVPVADDCIRLTPNLPNQSGSAWYPDKINLTSSFRIEAELYFGGSDAGADGIAFVLQPVSTAIGGAGSGMGYFGIVPSVAVEFDTYQNGDLGDPACDHTALMSNGQPSHLMATALTPPVNILSGICNAEDGLFHQVSITWDADLQDLEVYVDCVLRLAWSGDMVALVFGGDPEVFFGYTAGTGALSNEQIVCYRRLEIDLPPVFHALCEGDSVQLFGTPGFDNYVWSPVDGISDTLALNPWVAPNNSTWYSLSYTNECGETYIDSFFVEVSPQIPDLELPGDTVLCVGESLAINALVLPGYDYLWSNGSTATGLVVGVSGWYSLQVSNDLCSASDSVQVTFNPLPEPVLSADKLTWCPGEEILISASGPADSLLWNMGASSNQVLASGPGWFEVVAWLNGCSASDSLSILPEEDCGCHPLFPSAFSPNGDGNNDVFRVRNIISCFDQSLYSLQIFNRWGQLVFLSNDPSAGWDGTFRGVPSEVGVYVFVANIPNQEGQWRRITGSVTLVR